MKIANIPAKSKSFEFSSFVAGTSAVVRWTNSTRNGFEFTFVGGRFYCSLFLLEKEWNERNVFHFVRNFLGWQIGRQRDEGIWKIQRHFRIFLFVNFIYKLPHNSPQYNMCHYIYTRRTDSRHQISGSVSCITLSRSTARITLMRSNFFAIFHSTSSSPSPDLRMCAMWNVARRNEI